MGGALLKATRSHVKQTPSGVIANDVKICTTSDVSTFPCFFGTSCLTWLQKYYIYAEGAFAYLDNYISNGKRSAGCKVQAFLSSGGEGQ